MNTITNILFFIFKFFSFCLFFKPKQKQPNTLPYVNLAVFRSDTEIRRSTVVHIPVVKQRRKLAKWF